MRRLIQALTIIAIAWGCNSSEPVAVIASCPENGNKAHSHHAAYKQILERYMAETRSPGCLMLVARKGEPVWAGGAGTGDLSQGQALCADASFRVGSLTKVFTATLVLQLVQQGRIVLDDRMIKYLPQTWNNYKLDREITIRSLLAHTSGLTDPPNHSTRFKTDLINDPEKMRTMSDDAWLEKYIKREKTLFRPGEGFSYSNAGYLLLGMLVERIENRPLAVTLRERLTKPLSLSSTYLPELPAKLPMKGYSVSTGQKVKDVTIWDDAEGAGRAYGGLVSSLSDLHKFYNALFEGQLISAGLLSEMKRKQLPACATDECDYGLGVEIWQANKHVGYGHNGSLAGMEVNALYFPETKTCVILVKNLGGGSDKAFVGSIIEASH